MRHVIFCNADVQATLRGHKTMFRTYAFPARDLHEFPRTGYPNGWWHRGRVYSTWDNAMRSVQGVMSLCKFSPGDVLFVRESWCDPTPAQDRDTILLKADMPRTIVSEAGIEYTMDPKDYKWRSAFMMPKAAARLFLLVTKVRVEPLQRISDEDCIAEGIRPWTKDSQIFRYDYADAEGNHPLHRWSKCPKSPQEAMAMAWDTNLKTPAKRSVQGWDRNPWVWVVEFEVLKGELGITETEYNSLLGHLSNLYHELDGLAGFEGCEETAKRIENEIREVHAKLGMEEAEK